MSSRKSQLYEPKTATCVTMTWAPGCRLRRVYLGLDIGLSNNRQATSRTWRVQCIHKHASESFIALSLPKPEYTKLNTTKRRAPARPAKARQPLSTNAPSDLASLPASAKLGYICGLWPRLLYSSSIATFVSPSARGFPFTSFY